MPEVQNASRLQVWGERELDMPLRVLNLIFQLGLSPQRITIERETNGHTINALLQISEQRGALLVEKLRSMVLIWNVTLSKSESDFSKENWDMQSKPAEIGRIAAPMIGK